MNVLFISNSSINPSRGGVEKTTHILARELSKKEYNCYVIFALEDYEEAPFKDKFKIDIFNDSPKSIAFQIIEYINKNNIDVVINQQIHSFQQYEILKQIKKNTCIQLIYCFHGDPIIYTFQFLFKNFWNSISLRSLIKFLVYKFYNPYKMQIILMYKLADKFVMLSATHFNTLKKEYKINVSFEKLYAIPNTLPFEEEKNADILSTKKRLF
ncbi:MAG: glycosyltransferase [Tannerellaceae bacterium]|nr:glycosyltransferase [Tannerellaceae bacterium]